MVDAENISRERVTVATHQTWCESKNHYRPLSARYIAAERAAKDLRSASRNDRLRRVVTDRCCGGGRRHHVRLAAQKSANSI